MQTKDEDRSVFRVGALYSFWDSNIDGWAAHLAHKRAGSQGIFPVNQLTEFSANWSAN